MVIANKINCDFCGTFNLGLNVKDLPHPINLSICAPCIRDASIQDIINKTKLHNSNHFSLIIKAITDDNILDHSTPNRRDRQTKQSIEIRSLKDQRG